MTAKSDPWDTFNAAVQAAEAEPTKENFAAVAAAVEADKRQRWTCVDPLGPRTLRRGPNAAPGDAGTPCPVFHSDDHLAKRVVVCPNCGGVSVRHAFTGEV